DLGEVGRMDFLEEDLFELARSQHGIGGHGSWAGVCENYHIAAPPPPLAELRIGDCGLRIGQTESLRGGLADQFRNPQSAIRNFISSTASFLLGTVAAPRVARPLAAPAATPPPRGAPRWPGDSARRSRGSAPPAARC